MIGESEYWGRGLGTEAKMLLLDYAFNTLNLRRICSQVLAFNSLGEQELEAIVGKQLDKLKKKLAEDREVYLEVPPEGLAYLARESLDPAYGARPVGRTMQRIVLSPLAGALQWAQYGSGQEKSITRESHCRLCIEGSLRPLADELGLTCEVAYTKDGCKVTCSKKA